MIDEKILRYLYSLSLYLLVPFVLARLVWRSRRASAYRRRWAERFGFFDPLLLQSPVWVHAVSVGEVLAAVPLVKWLRERGEPVLMTTTTWTGAERVRAAFGSDVPHLYCPYDLPDVVSRFLSRVQPRFAIIVETELWPNLFHACAERHVPVVVVNARLSARSATGYAKVARLMRAMLRNVSLIAAQGEADAARLRALGAIKVEVTGNIKFDLHLPASLHEQAAVLRRTWGESRLVWLAASTHAGEEEQVLDAFAELRRALPDSLLVLAPRHPERFNDVAALCRHRGYMFVRRSERQPMTAQTEVFLLDTMGELPLFYAAADLAFVGGSLMNTGGHNVLEPAALGKAVIVGPHTFNFLEITAQLVECGAATRVDDSRMLAQAATRYLRDANLRDEAGRKGLALVEQSRGALARLQNLLLAYLPQK